MPRHGADAGQPLWGVSRRASEKAPGTQVKLTKMTLGRGSSQALREEVSGVA